MEHVYGTTPEEQLAEMRYLARYDCDTGKIYWNTETNPHMAYGKEILNTPRVDGTRGGWLCRKQRLAHHVAWALYYGEFAPGQILHRNGNRSDNRIANLYLRAPGKAALAAARNPALVTPTAQPLPVIRLPWFKTSEYSANARVHWAVRSKRVKAQRALTDAIAREAGWQHIEVPDGTEVHYTIETAPPPRVHTFDDDNALSCCKGAIDQLADVLGIDDKRFRFKGVVRGERSREGSMSIRAHISTPTELEFLYS